MAKQETKMEDAVAQQMARLQEEVHSLQAQLVLDRPRQKTCQWYP
jgi:hypothetical protein